MSRTLDAETAALRNIQQFAAAGDLPRAIELAEAALGGGLRHPLVLNLVAASREQQGLFEDALQLLREAVALAPADPASRIALGLCLQRLGQLSQALDCFELVLRLAPGLPFGHVNRGRVLQLMGRFDEAVRSYDQCLAIDSRHPIALAGKARIASFLGRFDEARRFGEQALAVAPGLPEAVIAVASAELASGATVASERRLRDRLEGGGLDPVDQAAFLGLLGDVLDAAGREQEAFSAYEDCNAILLRIHHDAFGRGRRATPYVKSMLEVLQGAPATLQAGGAADGSRRLPVFLIGFPRSGTTLLEVILDGHRDVRSLEERELMLPAAQAFMNTADGLRQLLYDQDLDLESFRANYWATAKAEGADIDAPLFLDKYPLNTLKLPLIARLFPGAPIIFAVRDPRDVVLSCFRRRFRMSSPMYEMLTLRGASEYYSAVMSFAQHSFRVFGLRPYFIQYERLLADFEGEMSRLCHFLGLEWSAEMGDFAKRAKMRASATPSTAQLSKGLDQSGTGHWRRYAAQFRDVMPILEPWIREFGYAVETKGSQSDGGSMARRSLFGRLRAAFARRGR